MTKEEFLKQLDEKLKENGVENTEEVLDIYRKRFDIYYEIDYKDEEIIEALGTPESIALRCKPHEEKQEEPEIIQPEEQKIEKDETNTDGNKKEYTLDISLSNMKSLHIIHKKSPGVSFFCNEDGYKDMYNFDIAEDSIKIKNRLKTTLFKKTNYNGTLEIGNDIKLKRLGIQTVATECNIDSVYAETISIKNVNGSYTLNNVLGTNIRIDNVNGKISANNLLSKEDIFLSTVSGKMEIENIESKGIYLNTISGNYEITNISADEVKLSTISGNIKIETARVKDKNINSSKISGEIIINKYL